MGKHMRKRVVSLGGGTGQPQVIQALRMLNYAISAVVAMADDGGSTGVLRREMGIVPPGDIRNCLVALAADPTAPLARSFQRRLSGHALGNLILAVLNEEAGSFSEAVAICERMLGCVGSVFPSTEEFIELRGITRDGRTIAGEDMIGHGPCTLSRVWLEPSAPQAFPRAVEAILQADLVVMGPGSLFTSILPNVLVPGIAGAIKATHATRVFVCPKADTQYETWGLAADEYVEALFDHGLDGCVDAVLVHREPPEGGVVTRAFCALTAQDLAAGAARRAFEAARRSPHSEDVLKHIHAVRAHDDVLERLRSMVPVVVTRDFSLEGAPTAHDPVKLAQAIQGVSECRSQLR